jgi:hypothetical protein
MGGWGLKNLPFFQRALSANTLWRILMKPGLWSKVIKAKYFPQIRFISGSDRLLRDTLKVLILGKIC